MVKNAEHRGATKGTHARTDGSVTRAADPVNEPVNELSQRFRT